LKKLSEECSSEVKKIVALTAEDAYSEYIDDAVQVLQRSEFTKEVEIKEGM